MSSSEPDLAKLRAQIAETTKEIIKLAGRRNDLALKVGKIKTTSSLPSEDLKVENELIKEVAEESRRVGLDPAAGLKILGFLLTESKRVQGVQQRPPTSLLSKALELERSGKKLVRLDVGEPDFKPPQEVLKACADAMFGSKTHYTESRGIPELREGVRKFLKRKNNFEAEDDQITVTPGGRFGIYSALACLVGEGENAIVIDPSWPAYKDVLAQLGATASLVHTTLEEEWSPTAGAIEAAIRPNTRAMVISYPNNPTGKVLSRRLFDEVVELADANGLTVISDEIYNEYSSKPVPSILDSPPRSFILTSSFSKSWSMTGFRVGYTISSRETIAKVSRMISLMLTSVPEFIQYGAVKALEADWEVRRNVSEMKRRVEVACEELDKLNRLEYYKPDGAMYIFPRVRARTESRPNFPDELLEKGVSVAPGEFFGDYGDFFRISLGQPREVVLDGLRKIGEALA